MAKKQLNQVGRIDILIIIESWIGIKNLFETNKRTLNRNVPDQWLITVKILIIIIIKISIRIRIKIIFDFNTISENGRHIYEWNQINQTILEITFDRTSSNDQGSLTFWRFGISKFDQYSIFRNTFQCHWTRITETQSSRIDKC